MTAPHEAALRVEVLGRLETRLDEVLEAVVATLRQEVAPPRPPGLDRSPGDARERGLWYLRLSLAALAQEGHVRTPLAAGLREVGRERLREGVQLDELLRGYQVGMRVLWEFVLEEVGRANLDADTSARLLEDLSQALLRLTTTLSATVSEGYAEAAQVTALGRERVRHELWEELLAGARGTASFVRRRAEAAGYRLDDQHVVATVAFDDRGLDLRDAEMLGLRAQDALRRAVPPPGDALVGHRDDHKVAVYPLPDGTDERAVRDGLQHRLDAERFGGVDVFAAIGRAEPGVEGIAVSHQQAARTLQLARETGASGRVLAYVDHIPSLLLAGCPELATDLWRATVAPLARHDAERGSDLVHTLGTLIAAGGNRMETAKRLHVHRHTLRARMSRIESLSGRDLDDAGQVQLLALGLQAHALLGDDATST